MKVGILGAGFMGRTHAQAYQKLKEVEIAGIADVNKEKAINLAKRYDTKSYFNPDDLISRKDIEVIDICLPTPFHCQYVVKAASHGKNILCEKPIALSLKEADVMIDCAKKYNVKFMVAHTLRFWPEYVKAKQIVEKKILGRSLSISTTRLVGTPAWSEGNWILNPGMSLGAVVDLNIHDIDFTTWVLGKPKFIFTRGIRSLKGAYDHVISLLGYENGNQAFVESGWMLPRSFPFTATFRILCEKGCVDFNFRVEGTVERRNEAQSSFIIYKENASSPLYEEVSHNIDPYREEISYFINCIKSNREPEVVTPDEARLALRITLAGIKSIQTGSIVKL